MLTTNDVDAILGALTGIMRVSEVHTAEHSIELVYGEPGCLDDIKVIIGEYKIPNTIEYLIRISAVGAEDTFRVSSDHGTTWSTNYTLNTPGEVNELGSSGVIVRFPANTGHTLGTTWRILLNPVRGGDSLRQYIANMTDVENLADIFPPIFTLAKPRVADQKRFDSEITTVLRAIETNLGESLSSYIDRNEIKVHYNVAQLISNLNPQWILPPETILGILDIHGVDDYTFTPQDSVDTTKYGGGWIQAINMGPPIGSLSISELHVELFDGTPASFTHEIPLNSMTQFAVNNIYDEFEEEVKSITSMTIVTGGEGSKLYFCTSEVIPPRI